MKMKRIIIVGIILAIAFGFWFGITAVNEQKVVQQERYTYTGTVTAIVHGNSVDRIDKVWLNSNPEVIEVRGPIELVIGESYEITINGMHELINAKILDD